MSWREILGVAELGDEPHTHNPHNPHNAQKTAETMNCADIAYSAHRKLEEDSKLLEALADACRGLAITPLEVQEALAPEGIEDWRNGHLDQSALAAFASSLIQRREMDQGQRPEDYSEQAYCRRCGPIWLWFSGEVLGCPWCWNRVAGKPIPRPCSVHCGQCSHFERIDHPHLGHCTKDEPEAIAGLWDTDRRDCARWLPLEPTPGGPKDDE